MVGVLGIEASAEGYFSKKSRASYLINYRYSTTSLMSNVLDLEGLPTYQDLSFKFSIPTKKFGDFSIFGLGGANRYQLALARDTSKILNGGGETFGVNYSKTGVIGITNKKVLNSNSYLSTNVALSGYNYDDEYTKYSRKNDILSKRVVGKTLFENYFLTTSMTYNYKRNSKQKFRLGFIVKQSKFQFNFSSIADSTLFSFIDKGGTAELYRTFIQWKYRLNKKWTLNTGAHFSFLALNNTLAADPRFSLSYQFKQNQSIAISAGMHSKPEHISTYFIDRVLPNGNSTYPNKNLKMLKAMHLVLGYDWSITENLKLKVEGYYQHLYDIPVSNNPTSSFSILNVSNVFKLVFDNNRPGEFLVSEGTAKNYGIDITFERYFNNGFYYLATGSIFDSKFKTLSGKEYQTKYASNYSLNILGGKEIKVGKTKQNIFGFNGKIKYAGGNRYTPVDLEASILAGKKRVKPNSAYTAQIRDYFRIDLGLSYKINGKKSTHTFMIDIQNVTNRKNAHKKYFSSDKNKIIEAKQNGLIPVINYKIEF